MNKVSVYKRKVQIFDMGHGEFMKKIRQAALQKEEGLDGILVTVGLCIIALALCVVMKDSLKTFVETVVTAMTQEAQEILSGVTP